MNAIELVGVGKQYRLGDGLRRRTAVWSLRDVSLVLSQGESVGVVGRNGAGKSTLLRLAAGVTAPTVGQVIRSGRIASILGLGDAFHSLLTGRENAITTGMIAGLSRREALDLMGPVEEFAGLDEAFEEPVRTYSSGMFLRLAFAVAIHVPADILMIDEVLAVGDLAFSSKCLDLLEERQAQGTSILLASHDLAQVRKLCHRAVWLDRGAVVAIGSPEEVTGSYARTAHARGGVVEQGQAEPAVGPKQVSIKSVDMSSRDEPLDQPLPSGWPLSIALAWSQEQPTALSASFGVSIHNAKGERCLDLMSPPLETDGVTSRGRVVLELDRLDLVAGRYHIDVGIYDPQWSGAFDYRWKHLWLDVIGNSSRGPIGPPHRWRSG